MRTRVKICCMQDREEVELAVRSGVDCLGFVAEMPSGPGPISDAEIQRLIASVPPAVSTFLLTSRTEPEAVVDHVTDLRPDVVQLVDAVPDATYAALRRGCPWVRIVQVVHVEGEAALAESARVARDVDGLLLDSGRPSAAVPELGGTGRTHDWSVSRRIAVAAGRPVFLAGGLRASNVAQAVTSVSPFGVDVCSGVRADGALSPAELGAFLEAVRRADRSARSGN